MNNIQVDVTYKIDYSVNVSKNTVVRVSSPNSIKVQMGLQIYYLSGNTVELWPSDEDEKLIIASVESRRYIRVPVYVVFKEK